MIQEKLTILRENNVINDSVYDYAQEVLKFMKAQNIINNEDEADTFITHLAMATARQYTEETINSVDQMINEQIKADQKYDEALKYWNEIAALAPIPFRENEAEYLHLHLVTLLNNY
ncbi:hypothetical protein CAT7_00895 [Carnobacterium sp. AT7]|uniref:PRD domain-containing protein n=1 Tax=Carnobacterium sp. AT7 TaxID=333990 RepID=UPI00015F172D|nr:PRD domain-containing protein [Carnobacterium sp. AT7]EDP68072.1 hypothetical protein CAT7_00895 [Carnobacterium sp. AT7]